MSFSLPSTSPSSILGQWILGLYASVVLPASPARFYFEIMDGSTSVAIGSTSPTSINLSTPLQVYTSSLLVPARAYGALTLNLYVTTQASSALTIGFNGLNLSYLSTSIQLGARTVISLDAGTLSAGATTVTSLTTSGGLSARTSNTLNNLSINNGTCTGVDFIATSDQRTKTNITTISNALDIVNGLRGVYFTRIGQTKQAVGVIAQEIEPLLPQVVYTDSEGLKSVSYGNMVGVLIEAVKTLSDRLEKIEKKE